jgi:hypothetical protein
MKKPIKEVIENIKCSMDIIISLKLEEALEKYRFNNDNPGSVKDYEELLQKLEQNIREHISIQHQYKIERDKYIETIENLEKEKIILLAQLVSNRLFIFFIIYRMKKKENLMSNLKN